MKFYSLGSGSSGNSTLIEHNGRYVLVDVGITYKDLCSKLLELNVNVEQIEAGDTYKVFKRCVSISLLNFTLFPDTEEFYSCFHLLEDTRHTLYTDKMEFHVLEFPKLPEELKEDSSDMLLWAKFINAEKKEEFDMLAEKNPYIQSAYKQLQIISQDKQKRLEYEASCKSSPC